MAEAHWYVVHTYSGYENKVKANIDKTIENRHLEDEILEVRIPMQDVVELKNGAKKQVQKKREYIKWICLHFHRICLYPQRYGPCTVRENYSQSNNRQRSLLKLICRIHQNIAYMCYRSSRNGPAYENMHSRHHGFSLLPEYYHAGYAPVLCSTPDLQEK